MILVLAITFSILVVSFSYLKKISKKGSKQTRINPELIKFYDLPYNSSPQVLYKQLVNATSDFVSSYEDLVRHIEFIEPLYKDRLVSDEYYENLLSNKKELELEKMVIESECELLKKGSKNELFVEAAKNKNKKKMLRVVDDSLFSHKRGVLENELKNKLIE